MTIQLTPGQLEKIATLLLNIGQTMLIISLGVSYFANGAEFIDSIKALVIGIFFIYLALESEKKREEVIKQK